MTFLEICRSAVMNCGVAAGSAVNSALPTVIGATGSVGRIVSWANDAWTDVEMDREDWDWMRSSNILGQGVSFQTIAGQASYPLGTGPGTVGVDPELFGKWDRETIWSYTTANGTRDEINLGEVTFDQWRSVYMSNANRDVRSRPQAFAVGPDQSLCLGPNVNSNYTVTGDYFVAPSVMVNDSDVPVGLPSRFHMLIVYRIMQKYGRYESAPEVHERGTEENNGMFAQLLSVRAPRMGFSGALA
jgi:hypothetical protein